MRQLRICVIITAVVFTLVLALAACGNDEPTFVYTPVYDPAPEPEPIPEPEPEPTHEPAPEPEQEPEQEPDPEPVRTPREPQPFTVVYDLLNDESIQSLEPGTTFEGRPGNTRIADSPYLAISTEWGGDVDLTIGAHENGDRYLHITNRTNMFLIRINHAAVQFEPGDTVTFAGRWSEPFFDLNDTWFSVIISAYGSQHDVVTMGINYSSDMPEDGTFYIYGVITEEMFYENLDTGPPHTGVRLYIWTSGEETETYDFFIDSIRVTRGEK